MVDGKPVETEEVIEEPEEITEVSEGDSLQPSEEEPSTEVTEIVEEPETTTTTTRRIMRRRVIKKIVMIDGKPVETEEVIEEPEEITEVSEGDSLQPSEEERPTEVTEIIEEPETTTTTTRRIIRRRVIKKIVMIDGKPVETEEVIEEPEEITEVSEGDSLQPREEEPSSEVTEIIEEPETTTTTTRKIIRRRIIKKIVIIDGKPVETEEVTEEPEEITEVSEGDSLQPSEEEPSTEVTEIIEEPETTTTVRRIIRRVIKKITMIDGKPVETEEIVEEPEEFIEVSEGDEPSTEVTELTEEPEATTSIRKIIRRIIKKIVMIDGKPVETEEVVEEPEEVSKDLGDESLSVTDLDSSEADTEVIEMPETTTVTPKRIIKKSIIIDGKPVETEEVTSEMTVKPPIEVTETTEEPETTTKTVRTIIRRRVIKKIIIVDGKPVETEEVVEEPEEITEVLGEESLPKVELKPSTAVTEIIEEPETTTVIRRTVKKIVMIDGKPVETEVEEPGDVTEPLKDESLPASEFVPLTTPKEVREEQLEKEKPEPKHEDKSKELEPTSVVPKEATSTTEIPEPDTSTSTSTIGRILRSIKRIMTDEGKPTEPVKEGKEPVGASEVAEGEPDSEVPEKPISRVSEVEQTETIVSLPEVPYDVSTVEEIIVREAPPMPEYPSRPLQPTTDEPLPTPTSPAEVPEDSEPDVPLLWSEAEYKRLPETVSDDSVIESPETVAPIPPEEKKPETFEAAMAKFPAPEGVFPTPSSAEETPSSVDKETNVVWTTTTYDRTKEEETSKLIEETGETAPALPMEPPVVPETDSQEFPAPEELIPIPRSEDEIPETIGQEETIVWSETTYMKPDVSKKVEIIETTSMKAPDLPEERPREEPKTEEVEFPCPETASPAPYSTKDTPTEVKEILLPHKKETSPEEPTTAEADAIPTYPESAPLIPEILEEVSIEDSCHIPDIPIKTVEKVPQIEESFPTVDTATAEEPEKAEVTVTWSEDLYPSTKPKEEVVPLSTDVKEAAPKLHKDPPRAYIVQEPEEEYPLPADTFPSPMHTASEPQSPKIRRTIGFEEYQKIPEYSMPEPIPLEEEKGISPPEYQDEEEKQQIPQFPEPATDKSEVVTPQTEQTLPVDDEPKSLPPEDERTRTLNVLEVIETTTTSVPEIAAEIKTQEKEEPLPLPDIHRRDETPKESVITTVDWEKETYPSRESSPEEVGRIATPDDSIYMAPLEGKEVPVYGVVTSEFPAPYSPTPEPVSPLQEKPMEVRVEKLWKDDIYPTQPELPKEELIPKTEPKPAPLPSFIETEKESVEPEEFPVPCEESIEEGVRKERRVSEGMEESVTEPDSEESTPVKQKPQDSTPVEEAVGKKKQKKPKAKKDKKHPQKPETEEICTGKEAPSEPRAEEDVAVPEKQKKPKDEKDEKGPEKTQTEIYTVTETPSEPRTEEEAVDPGKQKKPKTKKDKKRLERPKVVDETPEEAVVSETPKEPEDEDLVKEEPKDRESTVKKRPKKPKAGKEKLDKKHPEEHEEISVILETPKEPKIVEGTLVQTESKEPTISDESVKDEKYIKPKYEEDITVTQEPEETVVHEGQKKPKKKKKSKKEVVKEEPVAEEIFKEPQYEEAIVAEEYPEKQESLVTEKSKKSKIEKSKTEKESPKESPDTAVIKEQPPEDKDKESPTVETPTEETTFVEKSVITEDKPLLEEYPTDEKKYTEPISGEDTLSAQPQQEPKVLKEITAEKDEEERKVAKETAVRKQPEEPTDVEGLGMKDTETAVRESTKPEDRRLAKEKEDVFETIEEKDRIVHPESSDEEATEDYKTPGYVDDSDDMQPEEIEFDEADKPLPVDYHDRVRKPEVRETPAEEWEPMEPSITREEEVREVPSYSPVPEQEKDIELVTGSAEPVETETFEEASDVLEIRDDVKPLTLPTSQEDDHYPTSVDVSTAMVIERPSTTVSVTIRDELIDEHTAGPPEMKPRSASPSSEGIRGEGDEVVDRQEVEGLLPKESQPAGEERVVTEMTELLEFITRRQRLIKDIPSPSTRPSVIPLPSSPATDEEREEKFDQNLAALQDAIEQRDAEVVQKVIVTIVETVTIWLETIEYRIYTIRNSKDPKERQQQHDHLQHELRIIEEKLTVLEQVSETAEEILTEEVLVTVQESVKYLRKQVSHVEKVRQAEEEEAAKEDVSYKEHAEAVSNIEKEVSALKDELVFIQEGNMPTDEKVIRLETLLSNNDRTRDRTVLLLMDAHDFRQVPGSNLKDDLNKVQADLRQIHDSGENELERLLRLSTTTTEYEETLKELSNLIEMAENVLNAKVFARDLDHLNQTIEKHKRLFISLRQCQKVLESLDTALAPSSRIHYQQLYSQSYLRASQLLDKATQRHHHLVHLQTEWSRLATQLEGEEVWSLQAADQMTEVSTLTADSYTDNTEQCKDLLVEAVQHEAHTGHLVEVARKMGETITCTALLDSVTSQHQKTRGLRQDVGNLLERLEEFHVHWTAYQTQMDKLQEWCRQAWNSLQDIDLTPENQDRLREQFNEIWNLKAQFDSQSVLLNEAMNHFDKSVGIVTMTDESLQRHFLTQFKTEWTKLEELLQQKERELHRIQIQVVPVPQLLSETQDTLSSIEEALRDIDTHVTSIEQLREISDRYKILHIKVMNSKENLDHLTQVTDAEEDQDEELIETLGQMNQTCQELVCTIQQRITSLEFVLDNVQKTVSRVERISLTMMHLESTLERCQAVDKEGEQILKAAIHSCKTIYEGLARAEEDIAKVRQSMEALKQDPHHPCQLSELESQIVALQERLTSLAATIKETKGNLKDRLDLWQKFMSSSDAVDKFLQEVEYLMEGAVDLRNVNAQTLKSHVGDLQNLQGTMSDNEELLETLRAQAVEVEKSQTVETQITRWNNVSQRLVKVILRYETALELWARFEVVQEEVRVWVESKHTLIVSLQTTTFTPETRNQLKLLAGEAAWSGERVSELRQLAQQIQLHVAEESSRDIPLVAEVERLGFRITNLTDAIHQLSDHLAKQSNEQETKAIEQVTQNIDEAKTLLALPAPPPDQTVTRAKDLQQQLLTLGSVGGNVPDSGPPPVVEAWQAAIQDTHSRYQQVVAGLGGDDDQLAAALTTWRQYVDSVEASMAAPAPASREGLHEAARLCQVHRSILNTQTNVLTTLEDQAAKEDQAPRLANLQTRLKDLLHRHRTVLTTVSEREQVLLKTINTWETYRLKVAQLQSWLLALEQEKQGLQLRQVARRRLDKVILRLQSLLDQLDRGEEQVAEVSEICQKLVVSCDASIHNVIRTELASLQQRVTNLRAGVETWLRYLNRSLDLWTRYETIYTRLHETLTQFQSSLSIQLPSDMKGVQEAIQKDRQTVATISGLGADIGELRATREEMIDSLTPADLRLVTQRMWRVAQLQAELLHQYQLRISSLEDRLELWQLYDTRYEMFMAWARAMDAKVGGGSEQYIDSLIRKLEHDYQEEINMKNIEKMWLISEGQELVACSDEERGADIKKKMETIEATWKQLNDKCNSRKQKLQDVVMTINKAEVTLAELKEWLFIIEKKLSSPVVFQNSSKKEIDRLLEAEEEVRKEIERQSETISSVLNLCDMVIRDCADFDANGDTDSLQDAQHNLDRRWGDICTRSAERKSFIKKTWKMWQELTEVHTTFLKWLTEMESRVGSIEAGSTDVPTASLQDTISTVHELQQEIHDHTLQYEELNQKYRVLARPYGRENRLDKANEIRTLVKTANLRFHTLNMYITVILKRLRYSVKLFSDFESLREENMTWLNDFDRQLTEYEHTTFSDPEVQRRTLLDLVLRYQEHEASLAELDACAIHLYQRSCYPDCMSIEESLEEYWTIREILQIRLQKLREVIQLEIIETTTYASVLVRKVQQQPQEVRVERTWFTEESAPLTPEEEKQLEVDMTLNLDSGELTAFEPGLGPADPSLLGAVGGRSLSAELRAALDEARRQMLRLEEAIKCPTPQGAEVDKSYYSFSKLLAGCRSSVDLLASLARHTEDDEQARLLHPDIAEVTEEFAQLEVLAQAKQGRLKENSETSSLTCPLCCRRNWQQFENDMWRLEQWLSHAEATQSTQHSPPSHIEQLEEASQDHREFLMDLDGHKSVIMSLNIIGKHLAEHTRDQRRAIRLRDRLAAANSRWESVCSVASSWQTKLQAALMGNKEFHSTISDLLAWADSTEESLRMMDVEDEEEDEVVLRERATRVLEIRAEVERCEPRVASLHEAAQHLLSTGRPDEHCAAVKDRLSVLTRRLQHLLQLCSLHINRLSQRLGQDVAASYVSLASSAMYESAEFSFSRPTSPASLTASYHSEATEGTLGAEAGEEGVVRRSYRFLGRVMRAALPIQALMLLMLGVASLVPSSEDDYACSMANNFARSFDPMLRYTNGAPPF